MATRTYIVESKSLVIMVNGTTSTGVVAEGYPGLYLHAIQLEPNDVELGQAYLCQRRGPWQPVERHELHSGRWTTDTKAQAGEARWWFAIKSPKAHWPGNKSLRAYNPLTRNPRNPLPLANKLNSQT